MSTFAEQIEGSPYGEATYQAIVSTLDSPELSGFISDSTRMQIGGFLTTAYTVATAGGDVGAIVDASADLALSIAGELFADLLATTLGDLVQVVPLIGAAVGTSLDVIFGGIDLIRAEQQKAMAEEAAEARRFAQDAMAYTPVPTGSGGAYLPQDFFDMCARTETGIKGEPIITCQNKVPAIGVLLELFELRWPGAVLPRAGQAVSGPARAGFLDRGATAADFGLPESFFANFANDSDFAIFPLNNLYADKLAALRVAVLDQGHRRRWLRSPPRPGDGGQSVWPVYMDLLYALLRWKQWPWGVEPDPDKGFFPVAPLNAKLARALYRSPADFWPPIVATGQPWARRVGGQHARMVELALPGRGNWGPTLDGIFSMVDGWRGTVAPLSFADRAALERALTEQLPEVQKMAESRLRSLGFRPERPTSFGASLSRAVSSGLVSPEQAQRAARRKNAPVATALALALTAGAGLGARYL